MKSENYISNQEIIKLYELLLRSRHHFKINVDVVDITWLLWDKCWGSRHHFEINVDIHSRHHFEINVDVVDITSGRNVDGVNNAALGLGYDNEAINLQQLNSTDLKAIIKKNCVYRADIRIIFRLILCHKL